MSVISSHVYDLFGGGIAAEPVKKEQVFDCPNVKAEPKKPVTEVVPEDIKTVVEEEAGKPEIIEEPVVEVPVEETIAEEPVVEAPAPEEPVAEPAAEDEVLAAPAPKTRKNTAKSKK